MTMLTTQDGANIFYKDWGRKNAQPIMFHHGWPLSADDWDIQMLFFLSKGFRVIAHDRRGHGRSDQTDTGNEMDTYAADVAALVRELVAAGHDGRCQGSLRLHRCLFGDGLHRGSQGSLPAGAADARRRRSGGADRGLGSQGDRAAAERHAQDPI